MLINPLQTLFPLRSCLNCGSAFNLRTFFCRPCHNSCWTQFGNRQEILLNEVRVKPLLRWPSGQSDVLSKLARQMKDENQTGWKVWAEEFVSHWELGADPSAILVTGESSSGKRHAENWTEALAQCSGYPLLKPLKLSQPGPSQKELNRVQRQGRRFESPVEFSNMQNKRVIFADDIVTTGSTATGAFQALKKPAQFEVWCLIYREA